MSFKRILFPLALGAVLFNVGFGVFAYLGNEPLHAFGHGAAALAFGMLAVYLRRSSPPRARTSERVSDPDRMELLESDLTAMERELRETKARLDFADQLLNKKPPPPTS